MAAIFAAAFIGVVGLVLFWTLSLLLGIAGVIASLVALAAPGGAKRDALIGLATSLFAVVVPAAFIVWLVRSLEFPFGGL